MRVVVLSANEERQTWFIRRLAKRHTIVGIVVDSRYGAADRLRGLWKASGGIPVRMLRNMAYKLLLQREERTERRTHRRWFGSVLPSSLEEFPLLLSRDINGPEAVEWVRTRRPDAAVVFGTRLLKPPLTQVAPRGALNLHTGLSPYYRGGHSTFFALYNEEPEYIGATVHLVDSGIDSGDLLLTARPRIDAGDTLYTMECKVIDLGTALMEEALDRLEAGRLRPVRQWTEGRLYYARDFTLARRRELARRMRGDYVERLLAVRRGRWDDVRTVA